MKKVFQIGRPPAATELDNPPSNISAKGGEGLASNMRWQTGKGASVRRMSR